MASRGLLLRPELKPTLTDRTPGGLVPTARSPNAMPASSLEALEHWNVSHYAAGDILLGLV